MADWWDRDPSELQRSFELESGTILDFSRNTKNGYWRVKYRGGPTPINCHGEYTTFGFAMAAVERHFSTMKKPHKIVREIVNAP